MSHEPHIRFNAQLFHAVLQALEIQMVVVEHRRSNDQKLRPSAIGVDEPCKSLDGP